MDGLRGKENLFMFFSLDMLDKIEPPLVPDGYGISVAFDCLLMVVKSVQSLIEGHRDDTETPAGQKAAAKTG